MALIFATASLHTKFQLTPHLCGCLVLRLLKAGIRLSQLYSSLEGLNQDNPIFSSFCMHSEAHLFILIVYIWRSLGDIHKVDILCEQED